MQDQPMNKNLMITLVVVVVLGLAYGAYTMFTGGVTTGDIPASGLSTAASAPPPVTETPPAAPTPPAMPGMPGGAPAAGGQQIAAPGAGGPIPPGAGGAAPPAGAGGGAVSPPGPGGAPAPAGAAPGMPSASALTPQQKDEALSAFEKIDSHDIMKARQEEAKNSETVVDAENELPYPDTGRTDPLFINSQAIPEELRPPRTGETDYDAILDFLITAYGTELLDSVQIEVWSVMQIGLEKFVNMSINGMLATIPEGRGGTLPNGVNITVASATQSEVIVVLSFSTAYTSVSKTKSFIPKE